MQRDLEKSLGGKKTMTQSPAEHNWEQSRGRSRRLRAMLMIRNHHGKQKGRDLTHCQGRGREMLRTNRHKKETGKLAERRGDWKLQKSSSERAGRMGHVAWLPPGPVTLQTGVSSAPQGREM